MAKRPTRPLTRIEIENSAIKVGISRREIWKVKGDVVLAMIACRIQSAN